MGLVRPPMLAGLVCAHIVQPHALLGLGAVRLEEDGLLVSTLGAVVVVRAGQCGVGDHVTHDLGQLIYFVHNFVHIDTSVISLLLVITVPASIKKNSVFFVFFGIQHVVTFFTKSDSNKSWSLILSFKQFHFDD